MSADRTEECCTSLPRIVSSGYERVGTTKETKAGLKYYESASAIKRTDLAVIVYYDIVGSDQPQTDQQVDRISKGLGAKAVMPHFFGVEGGYPGDLSDRAALWAWVGENASPEKVTARTDDIIATLKAEGITKFVGVGFCWGGMQVQEFSTRPGYYDAAASIHGKAYTAENGAKIVNPFYNLPSQSEGAQPEFFAALPAGIKEKSKDKLFGDVPHGFAAARGKWDTDPIHKQRAEEVIEEVVNWVNEILPAP